MLVSRKGGGSACSVANSTGNMSSGAPENADDSSENEVFLTPCPILKSARKTAHWQER